MSNNIQITYERDAMSSYLVVYRENEIIQEYAIEMLKRNPIDSFLPLHMRELNGESRLYYEITSKQNLMTTLERKQLSHEEILGFFRSLMGLIKDSSRYLLSSLKICLDPHRIYISPDSFTPIFLYLPYEDIGYDVREGLKDLIELLFEKVNQEDVQGVLLMHRLYKKSKEETFHIGEMEGLLRLPTQEVQEEVEAIPHREEALRSKPTSNPIPRVEQKTLTEDNQVIDQLIQRNKKRQEFLRKQKGSEDPADQEAISPSKGRGIPWRKGLEKPTLEKEDQGKSGNNIPIAYLFIGCIQVVVIGAFLGLMQSGILRDEVSGSLRLDGVIASLVVLMVLNLYFSKKIYAHELLHRKKKAVSKKTLNMHKEKVYNRPNPLEKRSVHRAPKEQVLPRSYSRNRTQANHEVEESLGEDIEANYGVRAKGSNPLGYIEEHEGIIRKQERQEAIESEETQLLDEVAFKVSQEVVPCLVQQKGQVVDKIMITQNPFIIGKLKHQVDYVIDNSSVSRIHCKIIEKAGAYYIIDLNSKNGTYLEDMPLTSNKEYQLNDGSQITISHCRYTFEMSKNLGRKD